MLVLVTCIPMTRAAPLSPTIAVDEAQHNLHYISDWDGAFTEATASAAPDYANATTTTTTAHDLGATSNAATGLSTSAVPTSKTSSPLAVSAHHTFSGLDEDATWSVETGLPTAIGPVVLDKSNNGHTEQEEGQGAVSEGTTGTDKGLIAGLITGAIVFGLGLLLGLLYFCQNRKTLALGSSSTYSSSSSGSIEKSHGHDRTESMSSEDRALATHINTRLNETDEYMAHIGGMALVRSINSDTRATHSGTPSLESDSSGTPDENRPWIPARRKIASAENDVSQADHGMRSGSWISAHTPSVVHQGLSGTSDSVPTISEDHYSLTTRPMNPTALRLANPDESMSDADDLSTAAANGQPARLYSHENLGINTSRYSTGSQYSSTWSDSSEDAHG